MAFKRIEVVGHITFQKFYLQLSDSDERKVRLQEIFKRLRKDDNRGRFIRQDKPYPERYRKLGVTNLYVDEVLSDRVIFTVRTEPETKIWQILDYLKHEEYDRLFGNKKPS